MAYTAINMLRVDLKHDTHFQNKKVKMHLNASNQNESLSNLRGVTDNTPRLSQTTSAATPSTFETHDDHMPHCTEDSENKKTELRLNYDKNRYN